MPLQTTIAADTMLDRMWATNPGSTFEVGLLDGDPDEGGAELTAGDCPGYARYAPSSYAGFWQPASDGTKSSAAFSFADATGPWDVAGEWLGIWVDGVLWDAVPLLLAIAPDAAGPFRSVTLTVRF